MRILYVINSFYWAGAEKLVYDLAIHMATKTDWVGVAAIHRRNNETEKTMISELRNHGVETFILDKRDHRDYVRTIRKLSDIIKIHRVDIVHAHCLSPGQFAKLTGLLTHKPVVYTVHSTRGYPARQEQLSQWMVKSVVSIGASAENYIKNELKISSGKISRIYNGVDTASFCAGERIPGFWAPWGGREGDTAILNVARVVPVKNQLCQIRAVEKCRDRGRTDIKLYILGDFSPEDSFCGSVLAYVREHGLEEQVHFLGMHSNVPDFLANADCFVMSSRYEGLSVAFLEAVIAGKPVLSSDLEFVHELNAISFCAAVFPQDDSDALARLLMAERFRPQNEETVRKFRKLFSMETFVEEHLNLYQSVLQEPTTKKGCFHEN